MSEEITLAEINDVLMRRAFILPTAEIYGQVSGFYDYGPVGALLRQKIIDIWRERFVTSEDNAFEIYGSLILPEPVFHASGHLDTFNDPITQCTKCKSMFRADKLIEEALHENVDGLSLEALTKKIQENEIKCPTCGGALGDVKFFNLMFHTKIGPTGSVDGYLRPETAQNIFLNFQRISHAMGLKLPFSIAQVGRAFRNEIAPRNLLARLREFSQMEIEVFIDPKETTHPFFYMVADIPLRILTAEMQEKGVHEPIEVTAEEAVKKGYIMNEVMAYYIAKEAELMRELGIADEKFWFRELLPQERAHYSQANYDLEVDLPGGVLECIGNAYRGDYDIMKHQKYSKKKLHIVTPEGKVIPHVVEPSFGVDRLFYVTVQAAYRKGDRGWTWFKFPPYLAPYEIKVTPLMRKDGLPERAREIYFELKDSYNVLYDETGSIGKRYARGDEIGIPFTVTIDYDTLEQDIVTIRDRDTMEQIRVHVDDLYDVLDALIDEFMTFENARNEFHIMTNNEENTQESKKNKGKGKKTKKK